MNTSNLLDPVQAERLSDVLYERLGSLIHSGEFANGDRLPSEANLAERFNVSRPMVREVLSRFRQNGVIVSRKGAGSFVRKDGLSSPPDSLGFAPFSSLAQLRKGYEFRMAVESEAAFWAARNRSPETLAAIRSSLEQMQDAIDQRAVGVMPDYEFHLAIARASGNEFFETVMVAMRAPMMFAINLSRSLSLKRPLERLRTVQSEHVAIFEAIEASAEHDAAAAMRKHISDTCERVFGETSTLSSD